MIEQEAQTTLALECKEPRARVSEELVQRLCTALADKEWHTAKQLKAAGELAGIDDRVLRWIAEENPATFVTGNKGYRLFAACTVQELNICAARLIAQGQKMIARGVELQARAHRAIHNREEAAKL